jgi:putative thiamine transport system permease protein
MLFLAGSFEGRTFRWMRRALSPILAVPHAAAAFGLAFLIAPSGLIARALSPWATGWQRPPDLLILQDPMGLAMMAGLITKEIPFLMLMALAALAQIDAPRRMAMGRTLGYAPMAAWFKTVVPALYPLLRLPIFAVIAYASAQIALADDSAVIPVDEVIDAMGEVGMSMEAKYKETALGGLAATPTGIAIANRVLKRSSEMVEEEGEQD